MLSYLTTISNCFLKVKYWAHLVNVSISYLGTFLPYFFIKQTIQTRIAPNINCMYHKNCVNKILKNDNT